MSGIVGLWNLDAAPADERVLSSMSRALSHRGPDGASSRLADAAGFAVQHMWVTPEEIGEVQPLVNRRGVMLAIDGRIDNRADLLDALRLSSAVSDAACVLAAYDEWDEAFPTHLNGDFALAVYDEPRRRLVLARDAIGIRPLYYFRSERLFAFASEIKALFAHGAIPVHPEDDGIADLMMLGCRPLDRQDVTCFVGVSAVVPAHMTVVTPDRTVNRRYWDFDTGRALTLASADEYAEAFREHFSTAVSRRIRSARPVAVSISGGLDSSSVFCQAHALLQSGHGACPEVAGISYIGAEGTEADERKYLQAVELKCGVAIEQFPIETNAGLPRSVRDQVHAIEAPFLDYMWGLTCELHQRTANRGCRVLLSGTWGDQVLFSPAYLADLARRFDWAEIGRHTREYARYVGSAEARAMRWRVAADMIRHFVPTPLIGPLKRARLALFGRQQTKRWFSDAFLQRALRFEARPATIGGGFHSAYARSIYLEARSKYHVHCMEWSNKAAALHGLDVAFPFLDRDLLAFLIAAPGVAQNRDGVPRALLRDAMRGVLPELVRTRTGKADFTAVANHSVAEGASMLTGALSSDSLAVRLGYLDAQRLESELARLLEYLEGPDCLNSWNVADLLGLELWLQVFGPSHLGEHRT